VHGMGRQRFSAGVRTHFSWQRGLSDVFFTLRSPPTRWSTRICQLQLGAQPDRSNCLLCRGSELGTQIALEKKMLIGFPFCSKTFQRDEAETVHIQPGVALKALKRWIEGAGVAEGTPRFRPISKAGVVRAARLTDGSIARIVKGRCA